MNDSPFGIAYFDSEIALLLIGALVSFLVQLCKKYGANPLVALGVISVGMAFAWAALTHFYSPEIISDLTAFAVRVAGMSSLLYNILKSFAPSVKSENMNIE